MAGERGRRSLALGHVIAGSILASVVGLQGLYLFHLAILAILHIATSYGLLKAYGWTPWLMGLVAAMGGTFAGISIYTPIGVLGPKVETYLLITGLTAYLVFLLASLAYAIYRRREFSA